MEQRLKEVLLDGEEVRWTGRPVPFKLMRSPDRAGIFLTWALSAAVVALAVFWLAPLFPKSQRGLTDLLVMLVVVAFLPAMLSLRPFFDKLCLERSTIYAITNFRVISLVRDDLMYLPLTRKLAVAVEHQERECGNLCFGEAVGKDARKSRSHAVLGIRRDSPNDTQGMLFYHVRQPEALLRYLA